MSEVAFTIAGQMTLACDGIRIEDRAFGGSQLRLVTAVLLVGRDQRWGIEGLAAQLWSDGPPDRWRPAVRGLVSRVRRLLADVGVESEVVTNVAGQYVVDLPSLSVDVEVARRDVSQALAALDHGDVVAAERLASRARDVLSRPVMGDIESPWLEQVRRRLADDHIEALLLLGQARRMAGRTGAARSVLAEAIERAPLREDAYRHLMQVEFHAGNLAAALDVYEGCRRHLRQELGVDPSPATQALYTQLLQAPTAVDATVSDVAGAPLVDHAPAPAGDGGLDVGPRPPRGGHDGSAIDLLERDDVLRHLSALVERVRGGDGHVALLRGEAGIGKTAVATALASAVATQARVLWGTCDDLLAPRPLGPVWDMASVDPDLADALRVDDQRLMRQGLIDVFTQPHRPTVVVFDDVHWADSATLDLLTLVGRRIARTTTLLVMTFRDVASDHPLSVVLGDLPAAQVHSIGLRPLSRRAVATLADDRDEASRVFEQTGGNPFLVSAMLSTPGDQVPSSVGDLMGSLVSRLTGDAQRLVQLVSVVPGRTELALLDEIDPGLRSSCAAAEDVGLLRTEERSVAFRHVLARTAIEDRLSEPLRRELHLKALVAGERLGHDTARLAHHARLAHDVDAMVRLLPQAAKHAATECSHREAIAHLRALEPHLHLLSRDAQADLLELRASEEVFARGTGMRHALAAVELRRQLHDVTGLGVALIVAARSTWSQGDVAKAAELAGEALVVLDPVGGEPLARAHAEVGRMAAQSDDLPSAVSHAGRALALAPEPSPARALALTTAGYVGNVLSYPAGSDQLEEAADIAKSLGLAWELQRARGNLIDSALVAKDIERARRVNDEALQSEDGDLLTNKFHVLVDAHIATAVGDYATAKHILGALAERGHLSTALQWAVDEALADVLVRSGAHGAAPVVEMLWDRPRVSGEARRRVEPARITAQYLWVFQVTDADAIQRCRMVLANSVDRAGPWAVGELALWLWLDRHLSAIPERAADPVRWLGDGRWRRAATWFADRGLPFEWAVALSQGDVEARLDALRVAQRIGALALAARLRDELRAEGVTGLPRGPRRATRTSPLGLTPRQNDVLGLVAEGLSNAEIAERLFLSVRTVENHVSAILAQLDVSDRGAAAAMVEGAWTGA